MPSDIFAAASCRDVADHLSQYLDGELGALDRVRLAMHLAACPRCSRDAAELARLIEAVHHLGVQRPG